MSKHAIALVLAAMLACQANAQSTDAASTAVKSVALEEAEKLAVYWDTPLYPADAKALNEQGTAEIGMDYVNGVAVGQPVLITTSKSPRLDRAAMQIARQVSFAPEGAAAATFTRRLRIPIEFVRDSHLTLKDKTCRELNDDVAYFRSIHPGVTLHKMRVYELMLGIYSIAYLQLDMASAIKASKAVPLAFDAVVAGCQAQPGALFSDLLKAEVKQRM